MQSDRLKNCVICGRLYLKTYTDHCLECYKEIEQDFNRMNSFLKEAENRNATIEELSEATKVSEKRLAGFIRDGRIYGEDFPNLGYPCAHCGKVIKRQVLCQGCYERFSSDISKTLKRDKLAEEAARKPREQNSKYWQVKQGK